MSASSPSATDRRSLSVVIPAYCERDNIIATLENVSRALAPLDITHEVLVIEGVLPEPATPAR